MSLIQQRAEVFWSLLLPVSTITLVVVILHVLSFYPAQVTQLVEYEDSPTFKCRWFESNLAPNLARFQGFVSDRINLPREVHVPKRSIINHRWCLDVEVASEYIHLIGGIWKNLEFTCEEADLMP